MKTFFALLAAAALVLLCISGCTVVHVHIGDTGVDAEAQVSAGYVVPTPKLILPAE